MCVLIGSLGDFLSEEGGVYYVLYFVSLCVSFRLLFQGNVRYRSDDFDAFFIWLYYTKLCCEFMEPNFELCYVDVFIGECIRMEFIIDKCKSDKRSLLGR